MALQLRSSPRAGRLAAFAASTLLVLVAGIAPGGAATVRNPEDLLIVDCLLPGQVRKLGRQATFMSARRPIRTTQADCEIRGGEYVAYDRANYQTALKVWMEPAISGDAEAQNYVGEIYHKGLGVEPDYAMAAQWYQKAASQGYDRARINLGFLYEQGLGVEQDLVRALELYREASGITDDELMFASTVQVQMEAKQAEIEQLQTQVGEERRTSQQLREEVARLRGELEGKRRELQGAERELQSTRSRLEQARAAVGADVGELAGLRSALAEREGEVARQQQALEALGGERNGRIAELEAQLASERARQAALEQGGGDGLDEVAAQVASLDRALAEARANLSAMQRQLGDNRSRLAEQRAAYVAEIERLKAEAEGRKREDWELMRLLETQLAAREAEVTEQRQQIAALEARVGADSGTLLAGAPPMLEILDPPLSLTRGRPAAMLRRSPGTHMLVGRVSAPQGVESVTVNGRPVTLAGGGLFRTEVQVAAGGSEVRIDAVDRNGAEAELNFLMVPQADAATVAAQAPQAAPGVPRDVKLGRYHALVIGNNSYSDPGWGELRSAVDDASAVARLLRERYGHDTTLLLNATRLQILSALNEMREKLGENDNLMVYYAGHGEIDEAGQGYWIPVDGRADDARGWISNRAISDILNTMEARHVLVVADSCYSGALTRSALPRFDEAVMSPDKWGQWVRTMTDGRSRTALTSGGVQPVPDSGSGRHSYFARAFLNVLEDNNRLLEAQRLFREIAANLALAAVDAPVTQSPQYAPIQFAGHETGEYFFAPAQGGRRTGP